MTTPAVGLDAGGHDHLFVHADTVVHRLPAQVKVIAALTFVSAVTVTDRRHLAVFGVHALLVAIVAALARVPRRRAVVQLVVEAPVLVFAAALPFVVGGPSVDVGNLSLSTEGMWGAWNVVAKATLGVSAMLVLTATTPVADLLVGLRRLRVPAVIVAIASFMMRYLDILQAELHRMNVARVSRGDDPRWLWQARAVASTVGALFVRSYERGERVHLAMLSRGFDGRMPMVTTAVRIRPVQWVGALAIPMIAWFVVVGFHAAGRVG